MNMNVHIPQDTLPTMEDILPTPPSIEEIVNDLAIAAFKGEDTIGAYAIHKIVNNVFEVLGVDKRVPPQMIYNYSRNGLLGHKGTKDNPNTNHQYNIDQVTTWVTKYTTKHSQ